MIGHAVLYRTAPQGIWITEEMDMFGRMGRMKSSGRAAVFATVAAIGLSAVAPVGAIAAPAGKQVASQGVSDATDFSSARRRHYRRGGGGNAAGLAAFGAIVGTIGAIAASQSRRDYYYDHGPAYYGNGYYGGPGYYSGGPAYYGPGYY